MQTEGHRHVWCDIRRWTDECIGAQSPASANNGTWGKLLALSKSWHLHYHNLMIIVKIKAISQGSCETQILRCFKAFGKVSKTCMGLLRWASRSKVEYPFSLVFSLYSIVVISQSCVYSKPTVMVNHTDQLTFLVISVSKMQALVNVEWKNYKLLQGLAATVCRVQTLNCLKKKWPKTLAQN